MKALDVMTRPVITIRPDASIGDAIRLMLQNRISGLPVVDKAGKLVGIVTEGDFLRRSEAQTERRHSRWLQFLLGPGRLAAEYTRSHSRKVAEVMTCRPVTAEEQTTVRDVVRLMEIHHTKRIPIMRDGRVVGIVSRANLLCLLGRVLDEVKPMRDSDSNIRATILAELNKERWAPSVTVIVRNGVVELKGAIFDERQRSALRVAAENVPGVREVQDHLLLIEAISATDLNPLEMEVESHAPDR